MGWWPQDGINSTGKRSGQAACSLTPPKRITVAAKKKNEIVAPRSMPVLSTAVSSLINMTVTAVTSGSVLLCLFAAKRFL